MLVLMILLGLVIAVILLILILSSNSKKKQNLTFIRNPSSHYQQKTFVNFYTIDGQYFPPESLTKRSIDEVIANSRLKLVRGSDVQSLHPVGHEGLFYVFNDRGNLEEICISAQIITLIFSG